MSQWEAFCQEAIQPSVSLNALRKTARDNFARYGVYPDSIRRQEGSTLMIVRDDEVKKLVVLTKSALYDRFFGVEQALGSIEAKVCDLDVNNSRVLRDSFPFTRPVSCGGRSVSVGLGDRLGLASPGHIRLVKDYDVFPVLAQQSIRELNLTGRSYDDVLAAASWAVFQEGYEKGFGADGDHLKTAAEVRMALDIGMTMITLDCSDHIRNDVADLDEAAIDSLYRKLDPAERSALENRYLGQSFPIDEETEISLDPLEFRRIVLLYRDAIRHTLDIYHQVVAACGRPIDFELSIDETLTPTSPGSHYVVATLLLEQGVEIASLAPRFCGEFQKGIDYRGDIETFRGEFDVHCRIARRLGYKISVHSGSDKFTVFPIVGEKTGGAYHLKTAGTNWLEAVRVIAARRPDLYRSMHQYALEHLDEAKAYYHISADTDLIPDLEQLADGNLPDLMDQDDARQLIHITYGILLAAKDASGRPMCKDAIASVLHQYEDDYAAALKRHIGRHFSALGLTPVKQASD